MKLKHNAVLSDFLRRVTDCAGEVWFVTDQGDRLNLKSVLSEYLFLSAAISANLAQQGTVVTEDPGDIDILRDFLEE